MSTSLHKYLGQRWVGRGKAREILPWCYSCPVFFRFSSNNLFHINFSRYKETELITAPPPSPPPPPCHLDGVKPLVLTPSTPPPPSPTAHSEPPEPEPCSSPLPPPCFPDPHPLCCHCTGTCPCSWGAPCRKCPKRTGRHHLCDWCPGSWCRWAPINHPTQMRSPVRKNLPRHFLEEPMKLSDKYWIVVFMKYCSMLYTSTWCFHFVIVINNW